MATLAILALSSCQKNTFVPPPPPKVTVVTVQPRDVTTFYEQAGRTEAFESVEVRARVKGILQTIDFEPGSWVEKGQLLFTIEPETYEAAVAAANADLGKAEAALQIATTQRKRKEQAGRGVSELDVEAGRLPRRPRLDLSYTKVKAPLSGRVSRNLVDLGNLVGSGEASLLTTIVNDSPVYAYFDINERVLLPYLTTRSGPEDREFHPKDDLSVKLRTSDRKIYEKKGEIDYIDNRVDPDTGTIQVRAVFANPDKKLAAGLFVKVMLPEDVKQALLVPRLAIQRDLSGRFVLVVDKDGTVVRRNITPQQVVDTEQVVTGELEAGDRVIVQGLQRAREGIKVDAEDQQSAQAETETEEKGKEEDAPAEA